MEELDVEGLFWLATNPGDQVAGRLRFDSANGGELNLIGAYHEITEWNHEFAPARIHGVAGKKLLTLDDCYLIQTSSQYPGILQERYRAPIVFAGAHFDENQSLEFSAVHLRLLYLEHWVGRSGTNINIIPGENSSGIGQIQITVTPLEKLTSCTDISDLELSFNNNFHPDPIVETTITQSCTLGFGFPEAQSLQEALKVCTALQNLLTIGVDSPSSVTSVSLSCADLTHQSQTGETIPAQVSLHAQFRGGHTATEAKVIHPLQMLFTFDDIGGIDGVARWLKTSAKFEPVINSLLSQQYLPLTYIDNRFLNIVVAAEALERIRRNQQNLNFAKTLANLIQYAGDAFKTLVGDIDLWVSRVVRARINNVVHRGLHENDEPHLYLLSESVYFLVVLCLLRECGVSKETLSNFQHHGRFTFLAGQLRRSL